MTPDPIHGFLLGPTAIAVHNDGNMSRQFFRNEFDHDLNGWCKGVWRGAGLEFHYLLFFFGRDLINFLDIFIRYVLDLFLSPEEIVFRDLLFVFQLFEELI